MNPVQSLQDSTATPAVNTTKHSSYMTNPKKPLAFCRYLVCKHVNKHLLEKEISITNN